MLDMNIGLHVSYAIRFQVGTVYWKSDTPRTGFSSFILSGFTCILLYWTSI